MTEDAPALGFNSHTRYDGTDACARLLTLRLVVAAETSAVLSLTHVWFDGLVSLHITRSLSPDASNGFVYAR